jgi:hypothetical protein
MNDDRIAERPLPVAPLPSPVETPRVETPRKAKKSGFGWVVATGLFVGIVAVVAYVSQFTNRTPDTGTPPPPPRPPDVQFVIHMARWEAPNAAHSDEAPHAMEFEHGVKGHYDFPFRNPNDFPVTIGFMRTSCDCTGIEATALSSAEAAALPTEASKMPMAEMPGRTWTELKKDERTGLDIPANGGGVVRMFWNSRKRAGEYLKLNIYLWMSPKDRPDDRTFDQLQTPIVMTTPIRFDPARLALGTLSSAGVAEGTVYIHSATRDKLPLVVDKAQTDELFDVRVEPLDAKATKDLETRLRAQKIDTRLRSASKAIVTLREQQGKKQLDQGLFTRPLPVHLADDPEIETPLVTAFTRGDVEIGVGEEMGKIVFRPFQAREGSVKRMPLWIENPANLIVEQSTPAFLGVKLKRDTKDEDPARKKWNLEVTIPPGSLMGTLPEHAVIILRTDTQPPRRIRIPVIATGGQG